MARSWTASQTDAITLRGKTLLVSAAAGSGKTSVLTERIIRSLLDPNDPADLSRMLVVTFTRAAAAELKSRIGQALSEALAKDPCNARLSKQLFLLGSAQISTIDAFFQKIVRANFDKLELPASFRIANEGEISPLAQEVLEDVLAELYKRYEKATPENDGLFDRVYFNRFAEALDHLMSNRSDGKLNELLLDFYNQLFAYPDGIELLKKNEESLRQAGANLIKTPYGRFLSADLGQQLTDYLGTLAATEDFLQADPTAREIFGGILSYDRDFCNAVLSGLAEGSYSSVQAMMQGFNPPPFSRKKYKPQEILHYQTCRAIWRERMKKYKELFVFSQEELERQSAKTADLCEMLYVLYTEYQTRLMREKKNLGILEFNDIRSILYRLLVDPSGMPSDFADQLSKEYQAVYIDEYQDVDFVQDAIFAMIGRDRRFMVGDIKQSIYGFRGSEPSIFSDYRRKFPLYGLPEAIAADGNCIFMSENFRCDQPIIDFTNEVCGFLFSACEASIQYRPQDDLVCKKLPPKKPIPQFPVPVTFSVFEKAKKDEEDSDESSSDEAIWVAAEISRLLHQERLDNGAMIAPSDISILVRTKAQGKQYHKELEALGIPVNATTSSDILSDPLLIDTLNLLRAIDNPYRDLPLTEFLLSPLGNFSLEELETIRNRADKSKSLYDALLAAAYAEASLDPLGIKALETLEWMESQRNAAGTLPADAYLRLLFLEEIYHSHAQEPALMFLYEQARTYQKNAWCGLYGFLQHFDKLAQNKTANAAGFGAENNAVTIMTVHHSKGLEFPVVFLASCGAVFNKQDAAKTLVYHKDLGLASRLYDASTGNTDDSIYRMLVKEAVRIDQNEESIRTLYVALTRARERLYVTGTLGGHLDKMLEKASTVQRGSRADILGCSSYLSWILASMEQAKQENREFPCTFRHFAPGEVSKGLPYNGNVAEQVAAENSQSASAEAYCYAEILRMHKAFSYPLEYLRDLPTKAAASKLQDNLLDVLQDEEAEEAAIKAQIDLMRAIPGGFDTLLSTENAPKATDIGTATHSFLEFCHFERLASIGVEEECRRLIEQGFILPATAEILNKNQLEAFQNSDLMKQILSAKRVIREQKFGLHVPMSELTQDENRVKLLREHTLFVQGSIDLLLETDEGIVLVDYKTDHITPEEQADPKLLQEHMTKKHSTQLFYYAKAVKEIFGRMPDEIYIYSLPLGHTVRIEHL